MDLSSSWDAEVDHQTVGICSMDLTDLCDKNWDLNEQKLMVCDAIGISQDLRNYEVSWLKVPSSEHVNSKIVAI